MPSSKLFVEGFQKCREGSLHLDSAINILKNTRTLHSAGISLAETGKLTPLAPKYCGVIYLYERR